MVSKHAKRTAEVEDGSSVEATQAPKLQAIIRTNSTTREKRVTHLGLEWNSS